MMSDEKLAEWKAAREKIAAHRGSGYTMADLALGYTVADLGLLLSEQLSHVVDQLDYIHGALASLDRGSE